MGKFTVNSLNFFILSCVKCDFRNDEIVCRASYLNIVRPTRLRGETSVCAEKKINSFWK